MKRSIASTIAMTCFGLLFSTFAQATPCPEGTSGDRPYQPGSLNQCVYTHVDGNLRPYNGKTLRYNIYCPGRWTMYDATFFGKQIVYGAKIKGGEPLGSASNIIIKQHPRLKPQYVGIHHIFHYRCRTARGQTGVATHFKLAVTSRSLSRTPETIAASCKLRAKTGQIVNGRDASFEYRCMDMFRSNERALAKNVAIRLMHRDYIAQARRDGSAICLRQSTDIQCAPCTLSDKLVVRVFTTRFNCPSATYQRLN